MLHLRRAVFVLIPRVRGVELELLYCVSKFPVWLAELRLLTSESIC